MSRQIIVNATPFEVRVAIMENARLTEIFVERPKERSLAGSIYKGRVTRVLPGMQAAFVDIGLPKAAFLHARDFFLLPNSAEIFEDEPLDERLPVRGKPNAPATSEAPATTAPPAELPPIQERLKKDQELLVQIAKEPIGTKGARVTCNVSLPGRYLVYLPFAQQVAVSRRIPDENERRRLIDIVNSFGSSRGGVILRTAAIGISKREIQGDLRFLRKLWGRIHRDSKNAPAPSALHQDLDLVLRTVRDVLTADVSRVILDRREDYDRVVEFVETFMPRWRTRIEPYERKEPIFERYGIESQIGRGLERKVYLKSGGHIVIDTTEALTAIDVNTGRFVGKTNPEDTILQTNLEAARAIVEQLRLRNIGGLIVIDFIDMEKPAHRHAVLAALTEALQTDAARTTILGMSELGLIEMTRKRTREPLAQRLCAPCPTCDGTGRLKSPATIAYELLRRIQRDATMNAPVERITVLAHHEVVSFLRTSEAETLKQLQAELGIPVTFRESSSLARDHYEVTAVLKKEERPAPETTSIGTEEASRTRSAG